MRLVGVELRWLALQLRRPVGTAAGVHSARPVALARVVTDEAEGWGECGALVGGTSVDPPIDTVWAKLAGDAVGRLIGATRARDGHVPEASRIATLFAGTPVDRMAAAALEMAVLDAELRAAGTSLARRLHETAPEAGGDGAPFLVRAGAMVGIPPGRELQELVDAVGEQVSRGFGRVRVKIEPGWDVQPLAAVRQAHPDVELQADANGAYRLRFGGMDDADRLAALDGLGLVCVEQPLPPGDLAAHAILAGRIGTPICLDESLGSIRRVTDAIRYGACSVACLKPSRLGGVFAARLAQELCREAGVDAFVGGLFESGLGRSANAALATLPGFTLAGDLSAPTDYLRADPFSYPPVEGGRVAVYDGPGIAPEPDPATLLACTDSARTAWFPYPS